MNLEKVVDVFKDFQSTYASNPGNTDLYTSILLLKKGYLNYYLDENKVASFTTLKDEVAFENRHVYGIQIVDLELRDQLEACVLCVGEDANLLDEDVFSCTLSESLSDQLQMMSEHYAMKNREALDD